VVQRKTEQTKAEEQNAADAAQGAAEKMEDKVSEESVVANVANEADVEKIINNGVYASVGVGLVPIPVVDFVGLTAVQLKMLHSLSKAYGVEFSEDRGKAIIGALISGFLPLTLARPVASLIKAIPVIGQTTGAVTMSILGGASTYAIGRVFSQHFASGGTFLNFDASKVKDKFKQYFDEGKKAAEDAKDSSETDVKASA
jgi:uncharacterized protein (DUF697 family)